MINHRTTCDPARIELFLQQKLNDEEQTAFESHLSDCDDCCRQLEATAASEAVWSAVCDSLRDSRRGQLLPLDGLPSGDSAIDSATGEEPSSSQATVLNLLAPTDDDRMLGRWGTYEVVGVVGSGGMGVVLKALDAALNRYVAIKVLAPHLGNSGGARKRFSREAQAAAAVVHDNVMEIYGVAENAGLPYLVMPYVRGPSLQRRLDGQGPLALVEILRVGMQAAAGLAAAHAQGLVHRDVKPANILLADGVERVKLTDFGLARAADDASLTKTGIIAGTPQYMSPKQARGESVDQRSDLFSLGSVLYAMCSGRAPFRAETSYGVLRRITDEEPRPIRELNPEIPDWLCRIVAKLMAKRPDDRFQSAREVAGLLEECLAHVQQPTVVPLPTFSPLPPAVPSRMGEGQGVRAVPSSLKLRNTFLKGTLAMLTLIGISLFAVGVVSTNPPDIAGQWTGEGWGQVVLTETAPGQYTGTYTDTVVKEKGPGKIDLKWSRIEGRFNGTWREGEDRFGDLSIRLADKEIRGVLTIDVKSKINPATPRLADVTWTRNKTTSAAGQERRVPTAVPQATRVLEVNIEKNRVGIKGEAPAGARISFYAGERNNGWGCVFPRATGFTASLEDAETGLNCRVVPETGDPILTLVGAKHIGSVVLSDGRFIFRVGPVHKERDGGETATIGRWAAKSGEVIEIGVALTPPQPPFQARPPAATRSLLAERPQLRFLAWQDDFTATAPRGAFHPDGSPADSRSDLQTLAFVRPVRCDASRTEEDHRNPHFLQLWFSHPLFDKQSLKDVTLLDEAGQPLPLNAVGMMGSRTCSAADAHGHGENLGWLTYTVSPKTDSHTVTVRLRYALGALQKTNEVVVKPNNSAVVGLEGGSQLGSVGQNVDGKAFVSIAVNSAGTKDRNFAAVAVTKDGRKLTPLGVGIGGNLEVGARTEVFTFDAPLSAIAKVRIGTRRIRTVEYRNVSLREGQTTRVEIFGNEKVSEAEKVPAEKAPGVKSGSVPDTRLSCSSFDFSIVVARHVMLLDGREIVTWPQIEEKLAKHAYPSPAHPGFYVTWGADEAGLFEPANKEMYRLKRDYKFAPFGGHTIPFEKSFRYDRIKTPADLKLDESARTEGIVVTPEGKPVANAEVLLVTPIDKSIPDSGSVYDIQLEQGRVNWPLDHVMTRSDAAGRFTLYPPMGQAFCIVALHTDTGIGLLNGKPTEAGKTLRKLTLAPWAGVNCDISKESENQDATLRSYISQPETLPRLIFDQSMGAPTEQRSTLSFRCTRVPPGPETEIERVLFGGIGTGTRFLPAASVGLLPGEIRQISLGPISEQMRQLLQQVWSMEKSADAEKEKVTKEKVPGIISPSNASRFEARLPNGANVSLHPGEKTDVQVVQPSSAASAPATHKVVDGDSLASLAERYLGSASRAMELYEANRNVLTRSDVLPIGAELKIPQTLQVPIVNPAAELKALGGRWKVVRVEKGKEADSSWARIRHIGLALEPATTNRLNFMEPLLIIRRLAPYPNLPYDAANFPAGPPWFHDAFTYRIDPTAAPKTIDLYENARGGRSEVAA
jgi:serine/threonine-protein kinase